MCVAATARRRRRQAVNKYRHVAKLGRPVYRVPDTTKAARRLQELIRSERERQSRKKK